MDKTVDWEYSLQEKIIIIKGKQCRTRLRKIYSTDLELKINQEICFWNNARLYT